MKFSLKTLVLLLCLSNICFAFTNMIYTDSVLLDSAYNNTAIVDSIDKNHAAIQILAPQVYSLNGSGVVWGSVSARALQICKQQNIKVMPLVTNVDFNKDEMHNLLQNTEAQQRAIAQLVNICKKNNYIGIQFDIENVNINDKKSFSNFIKLAASFFHKNNLQISVAIVPSRIPPLLNTQYAAWYYENWSGAYDVKALAKACDFVTIMAYDRHTTLTTPGPVAPMPWVKMIINDALKQAPANKVFLGIPFYSGYWKTELKGDHYQPRNHQIGHKLVVALLKQYKTKAKWDPESATASAILHVPGGLYSYLYVQNFKSVKAALDLAKQLKLRGISAWELGDEDSRVWPLLSKHAANGQRSGGINHLKHIRGYNFSRNR